MHKFPPDMDPLAAALLWAILPVIKDSQSEVVAATIEFDLTFSQLRMLFVLDHAGEALAVNELADRVALSMPAAGRAADALVRSGLLSRSEDADDRRIKRIALTPNGHDAIEKIGIARRKSAERFVSALNDSERAALADAAATLGALTQAHFPNIPIPCSPFSSDKSS